MAYTKQIYTSKQIRVLDKNGWREFTNPISVNKSNPIKSNYAMIVAGEVLNLQVEMIGTFTPLCVGMASGMERIWNIIRW